MVFVKTTQNILKIDNQYNNFLLKSIEWQKNAQNI